MNAKFDAKATLGSSVSSANAASYDTESSICTDSGSEQIVKKSSKLCRKCNGGGKCFSCHETGKQS